MKLFKCMVREFELCTAHRSIKCVSALNSMSMRIESLCVFLCIPHHLCLLVSSLKCALSHKSFRSYAHTFSYSYSSHIRMMLSLMFASTADLFAKWFAPTTAKYETKLKSMRIYAIIMNCTYLSGKKASSFFAVKKATSSILKMPIDFDKF